MHEKIIVSLLLLLVFVSQSGNAAEINNGNVAVIVNAGDPLSVKIGDYYTKMRSVPRENIIRITMPVNKSVLTEEEFQVVERDILRQAPSDIQAYVLAWKEPYRVACMSITSAISLGFDRRYCAKGCRPTRISEYYDSPGRLPFTDHGIRPSMLLAADSYDAARALIDRGVAADYSRPAGDVYLLNTTDSQRNVRAAGYEKVAKALGGILNIHIIDNDYIESASSVFLYFTGVKRVQHLNSVTFLPGAAADHLTSTGGVLDGGAQMSIMEWLRAGATGSYGTVVEPCNYRGKFPDPYVFMRHYLNGNTLLEAYWKAVAMPGQGLFIGEPLASPFKNCRLLWSAKGKVMGLGSRNQDNAVLRDATNCNPGSSYLM